jgi:hypothetical protein
VAMDRYKYEENNSALICWLIAFSIFFDSITTPY